MRLIERVAELGAWADGLRAQGRRIALVPTMGALHEGHLSLVRVGLARAHCVAASIFVNPTQFGAGEDYAIYPRDLAGDAELLRRAGCDVVFAPPVSEIYPEGWSTWVEVEGGLGTGLCGRARPGHFRGVTTVVARLFNAAKPHVAVFGEKDYQQVAVIRRMTRDLLWDIEIVSAPTVREADGLAMSSRNQNLSALEREQARALNAALAEARALLRSGERSGPRLIEAARRRIEEASLARIDYVELVDPDTLEPLEKVESRAVLALAVHFSRARLIDNALLEIH
jgi:pantoate--beta-alanine ligase